MILESHDPRLRSGLALFEAAAAITATLLAAIVLTLLLAPRELAVLGDLTGQRLPGGLGTGPPPSVLEALAWTMAVQNGVLLVGGLLLALWRCPPVSPRTSLARRIGWGVAAGGAAFALSGVVAFLQELAGVSVEEQEPLLEALRQIPLAAALPWVAVVAPVGEEVFFRGYLFRFLSSRTPLWLAHAVSALAFAGIHLNPSGFLVYASIAIVLSAAYRRSGALLVPVLAHAVHNALTLLVLYATD